MRKQLRHILEVAAFVFIGLEFYYSGKPILELIGKILLIGCGGTALFLFIPWLRIKKTFQSLFRKHRKQTVILFTDIIGYHALKSQDVQKAQQLLEKNCYILKPLIKKYNGTWLKEAVDCTISCFDSTIDAVNCALEIQRTFAIDHELNLRIGIHSGEIVFSGDDILGDGITEAAGVEVFAKSGGICITESVYNDIRNEPGVKTDFLGEKTLKSVDHPVNVYTLNGEISIAKLYKTEITQTKQKDLVYPFKTRLTQKKRSYLYYGIICIFALLIVGGLFQWYANETQRFQTMIAHLQPSIKAGHFDEVFNQLDALSIDINDTRMNDIAKQVAGTLSIESMPPGATVTVVRVQPISTFSDHKPITVGYTPISKYRLVAGEYLVSLTKDVVNPLEFLFQVKLGTNLSLKKRLLPYGEKWEGMVKIEDGVTPEGKFVLEFLIDRNEVTNEQFLKFVTGGGYKSPSFWPENIVINGQKTIFTSAMQTFIDRTGIPGPRFWSSGRYPEGKDNHPVVGISWYEASAYANWIGKDLPTWDQWWRAALGETDLVFPWGKDAKTTTLRANFGLIGTKPVGSYPLGISPFGCFDMAGNVREWLRDPTNGNERRNVVGGSWQHPVYMFESVHTELFVPEYTNNEIGFRCIMSLPEQK